MLKEPKQPIIVARADTEASHNTRERERDRERVNLMLNQHTAELKDTTAMPIPSQLNRKQSSNPAARYGLKIQI